MKTTLFPLAAALILGAGLNGFAQSTAITYQGRLDDAAGPVTGRYDLRFALYDDTSNGNQWGPPLTNAAVVVSNGLFTTILDFGSGVFTGGPRWIEIGVRTNGVGGFATLIPRQPLTPAPYAIMARSASNLLGTLPASQLSGTLPSAQFGGTYSGAVALSNPGNSFSGNGSGLTGVNAATLNGYGYCALPCYWNLTGNAGTAPGVNFVGTSDNQPLTFKVKNTTALQIRPGATLPNIVGGLAGFIPSVVASGVSGAVIAGGNAPSGGITGFGGGDFQAVYDDDGTIGGGFGNKVGSNNADSTDAAFATIAGGVFNTAMAYGATVAGGDSNLAGGQRAAVLGGYANQALGSESVVAGGSGNLAYNPGTFVGGGNNNTALYYSTAVMGGYGNTAVQNYSTIGGGLSNTNQSLGGFIGGGYTNYAEGRYVTVGGGTFGRARSDFTTVGGGFGNVIGTNAQSATIAGGESNGSEAIRSTISGGWLNSIGLASWESVLAGGSINTISSNAPFSVLSGGRQNLIGAGASWATILGGTLNEVNASLSLAAGNRAKANHAGAFVWADSQNADFASTAANQFCVRAAAGLRLSANVTANPADAHQLVIGPQGNTNAALWLGYQDYNGITQGGVIQSVVGGPALLQLNPLGGETWIGGSVQITGPCTAQSFTPSSDRNLKEHFEAVDPMVVLQRVVALPITRWNFKTEAGVEHLGPMAQDFKAAFDVGADDKHIATVDADGVALAAIQGLNRKLEEQRAENAELKARLEKLERLLNQRSGGGQ